MPHKCDFVFYYKYRNRQKYNEDEGDFQIERKNLFQQENSLQKGIIDNLDRNKGQINLSKKESDHEFTEMSQCLK